MSFVVEFEEIFKEYKLGVISHGTLYRDMQSWIAKIRGKEDPNSIIGLENLKAGWPLWMKMKLSTELRGL